MLQRISEGRQSPPRAGATKEIYGESQNPSKNCSTMKKGRRLYTFGIPSVELIKLAGIRPPVGQSALYYLSQGGILIIL